MQLNETLGETVILSDKATCDVGVSQDLLAQFETEARDIFNESVRQLPGLWQALSARLKPEDGLYGQIGPNQALRLGLVWVTNDEIQALNREFRDKDAATDVLTFSLLEEEDMASLLPQLPEVDLGEVYVSLPWAMDAVAQADATQKTDTSNFSHSATLYAMERVIHGSLHLLGVHHETMSAYNKVVAHQNAVIQTLYA